MAGRKADKATVSARLTDLVRITLQGAMYPFDVREYVREMERSPESPWHVAEGGIPLSASQIGRYWTRASDILDRSHERNRGKLRRRQVAKLNHLYAKAVTNGELSVARAVLRDLAELQRLYPSPEDALRKEINELKRLMAEGGNGDRSGTEGSGQAEPGVRASPRPQ